MGYGNVWRDVEAEAVIGSHVSLNTQRHVKVPAVGGEEEYPERPRSCGRCSSFLSLKNPISTKPKQKVESQYPLQHQKGAKPSHFLVRRVRYAVRRNNRTCVPICRFGITCRWCSAEGLISVNTVYTSFYTMQELAYMIEQRKAFD